MRREMIIFAYKQTLNQSLNSKTEAHSNPLWSVDRRGAGQYFLNNAMDLYDVVSTVIHEILDSVETHGIVQNILLQLIYQITV